MRTFLFAFSKIGEPGGSTRGCALRQLLVGVDSKPMPVSRTPAETITAYFAAIRAQDREAWVACFSHDGVSIDPFGAPPNRGPAALRAFFDGFLAMVSKLSLVEDLPYVCGSRAAVRWVGRGVGKTNGKPFVFHGIDVFTFDAAGAITEVTAFWDSAALFVQLA